MCLVFDCTSPRVPLQAEFRVQQRQTHFTGTVIPTLAGLQPPIIDESVTAPLKQVMAELEYAYLRFFC